MSKKISTYIFEKKKTTTIISPIAIIDANSTINKEPGNTFAISMYTHK